MLSSSSLIMALSHHALRSYCPLFIKNHRLKQCLFSKMNSLDYNSMKLGLIIMHHNFFFKIENGPYRIMPSGGIALVNDSSLFMQIWQ